MRRCAAVRAARVTRVDALLAAAAVIAVSAPMLLTRSGFAEDFTNSMWMVWAAGRGLAQAGHPSFFVNTTTLGAFYPLFAFYGGPLFAYTGAVSELLGGNAEVVFIGSTMLTIFVLYGSILWLGREFDLRGLAAHAPALTVVTSAYYMTDLYGRGAWMELVTVSALGPFVASGVYLVRVPRWRLLPMAIFVGSVVILTGGHNITLLWGSATVVAVLLLLWLALGAPRRLPYRRLAMLCALGLAGTSINAWFLLPDLAFASKVAVAHSEQTSTRIWTTFRGFNLPGTVLNPLRYVPRESSTPALYVQAPVWLMAWGIAAAGLLLWRRAIGGALRRVWLSSIVAIVLLLGMIMLKAFWQFVYYPFNEIQMPYRLGGYLFYAVAGLVLVAALALQRFAARGGSRRVVVGLRAALLGAVAVSLALCMWQIWVPETRFRGSYANRSEALASVNVMPNSWYSIDDYSDWQARLVNVPEGRTLLIPPSAIQGDRFDAFMNVPPGPQPIQTNIIGGSYLVHIGGLRLVGRNNQDFAIVKRSNGGSGPVHVVVETADSTAVEAGRMLSRVGLLATLAILGYAELQTLRVRRRLRAQTSVSG